jgi:hypothetical protein
MPVADLLPPITPQTTSKFDSFPEAALRLLGPAAFVSLSVSVRVSAADLIYSPRM